MANTYTLIASNVLTTTAASVTFSAIPATYTDLVLKFSARSNYSSTGIGWLYTTFNGASTLFSSLWIENNYGTAGTSLLHNTSKIYPGYVPFLSYSSSVFGTAEMYIPSYASSEYKPLSVLSAVEKDDPLGYNSAVAASWSNTAAITSITMTPEFGSLVSGSSFYLYGIKNT
jgi:hypothetical protein